MQWALMLAMWMDSSSNCAGVLTGWVLDTVFFPFAEFQFFYLILAYGVYGIHWRLFYGWRTGVFSVPYSGFVFAV